MQVGTVAPSSSATSSWSTAPTLLAAKPEDLDPAAQRRGAGVADDTWTLWKIPEDDNLTRVRTSYNIELAP